MGNSSDVPAAADGLRERRLLIIDDEVTFLDTLADACSNRGYEVSTATSADQGVEVALAVQPNLILLDVSMPGGSGWRALDRLAAHPRTRGIPVIMMSGAPLPNSMPSPVVLAGWLEKPFPPGVLFEALERAFRTKPSAQA